MLFFVVLWKEIYWDTDRFLQKGSIFAIFTQIVDVLPGAWFLRWIAQSRELLGRFLFRYSDSETDAGNYLNEIDEVRKNLGKSEKVELFLEEKS